MRNFGRVTGLAAAVLAASAIGASAMTWTLSGGSDYVLPGGSGVNSFNPNAANSANGTNELSSLFGAGTTVRRNATLSLSGPASSITYRFLGREAGAANTALDFDGAAVVTTADASGTSATRLGPIAAGALNFAFTTNQGNGGTVTNGDPLTGFPRQLAFLLAGDKAYAFFDDGGGSNRQGCSSRDCDFDDMIVEITASPSAVPLPAGIWLMGAMAGGLGLVGRRRRRTA